MARHGCIFVTNIFSTLLHGMELNYFTFTKFGPLSGFSSRVFGQDTTLNTSVSLKQYILYLFWSKGILKRSTYTGILQNFDQKVLK